MVRAFRAEKAAVLRDATTFGVAPLAEVAASRLALASAAAAFLAAFSSALLNVASMGAFTAGFIGKFYIIAVGVEAHRWWLVGSVVLGSAIGLYYYLRVMVTLFLHEPGMQRRDATHDWAERAGGMVVLGVATLVILLGLYPTPMINWVNWVAG